RRGTGPRMKIRWRSGSAAPSPRGPRRTSGGRWRRRWRSRGSGRWKSTWRAWGGASGGNRRGWAGGPAEVRAVGGGAGGRDGPVVAYAPSASMFTYLKQAKVKEKRPATLLALGDPAYPAPAPDPKPPPPPDHGLFVVTVVPNGNADLFGI